MGRSSVKKFAKPDEDCELPPPAGLSACTVVFQDEEYLVLSFPEPSWSLPQTLTEAEREVTLRLLRGATTFAIAKERGTSAHTVANQIASIFEKLGVTSRVELASAIVALSSAQARKE